MSEVVFDFLADPKQDGTAQHRVIDLGLDDFEAAILPVFRHFMMSLQNPASQSWQFAYKTAAERWGDTYGLGLAQSLFAVADRLHRLRGASYKGNDPLDLESRDLLSEDEAAVILMLHFMRRDKTAAAREALAEATGGRMDPDLIRAGLQFSHRHPAAQHPDNMQPNDKQPNYKQPDNGQPVATLPSGLRSNPAGTSAAHLSADTSARPTTHLRLVR
ncbi:hypothetical protein [Phaeobacter sp.]|uniref:hypothetical protein n=1 Tax=Phaeobacter sp. TaxID=1902409 RepID=UPI0025F1A003|nr:hypothetical protein [Phaeobacter sp.]